jgi:type II secretory pathway pseudopilin PulG
MSSPTKTPWPAAFTLVEVAVAIGLVGIGLATTIAALTKFNQFSATNRNSTGAYSLAVNQIDLIQSASGVPQDTNANILVQPPAPLPPIPVNGTQTLSNVPIYGDTPANQIVLGTMTTDVAPITINGVTTYHATVTVTWQYQGHGPNNDPTSSYQVQMSTLRAAD